MSEFIPINFDDAVETLPVAGGRYRTQITGCEITKTGERSKVPGSPQLKVTVGLPDHPNAMNVMHFVGIPNGQEEDGGKFKALLLKRFLEAYHIPYDNNGINLEQISMEAVGREADLEIQQTAPDAEGNVYNRLILPKLRTEANFRN